MLRWKMHPNALLVIRYEVVLRPGHCRIPVPPSNFQESHSQGSALRPRKLSWITPEEGKRRLYALLSTPF